MKSVIMRGKLQGRENEKAIKVESRKKERKKERNNERKIERTKERKKRKKEEKQIHIDVYDVV